MSDTMVLIIQVEILGIILIPLVYFFKLVIKALKIYIDKIQKKSNLLI